MIGEIFLRDVSLSSCVWQSTIFIVVGLVGSLILKHRSSRAHQVLFLAMIAAVIVPIMSILVKHYELGMFVAEPVAIQLPAEDLTEASNYGASGIIPAENIEHNRNPIERDLISATAGSEGAKVPWHSIVLSGWIAASLILFARLLVTFVLGIRMLGRAVPLHWEKIEEAMNLARTKLEIDKDVSILSSQSVRSPVIWCWRRKPILLIPNPPGQFNNKIDWTSVLCHELAHWKRRDHICGLLSELVVCILPWHPLLWWAKSRLVSLSEQACDDWVVASGQPGTDYAESLLDLTPCGQMAFIPAVVSSKRGLAGRVRRILKDKCGNPRIGALWALTVSIVAVCLTVGVACAQTRPAEPASAPSQKKTTASPTAKDKAAATAALFRAMKDNYRTRKAEDITLFKSAIAQGADLDAKNHRGATPLHIAIVRSAGPRGEMIRLLLEAGANPNARDLKGQTPLHIASQHWHLLPVRLLVSAGSDVNARDKKGQRPVMIAFELGQTDMFDLMVNNEAMVPEDFMAAYKGNLMPVQRLIENGKAQETFEQGLTLLHAAAAGGHTPIVELLLANGSDVRSQTQAGYTALHYAAAGNHREVAELLLVKGAGISAEPGKQTPLHWAIREHHKDMIDWLVARGANPNADGGGWGTPLHWAIWCWDVDTALLLVSHGGDIHLETQEYPDSPLYDSVWNSSRTMTEALVTKAGDTRAAKWAPLHTTVVRGEIQEIEDLLAKGADVNAKDEDGYTALLIAALRGYKEVVELLLTKGADIKSRLNAEVRGTGGWTALHISARHNRKSVSQLLIAKGADVNAKTKNGKTPLDLAKEYGNQEIVELLRKHGAKE